MSIHSRRDFLLKSGLGLGGAALSSPFALMQHFSDRAE